MAQALESLPRSFWRVHHGNSYTRYDPEKGFSSRCRDSMPHCIFVNKRKFEKHAQGMDCHPHPTALISVYDNEDDAVKCAKYHDERNDPNVTISHIHTSALQRAYFTIVFPSGIIHLPAWETKDEQVYFFSTRSVREYLWVDEDKSTPGEWFALSNIPAFMITSRLPYNRMPE